jgi:transcriptional regulator with XRE-family HTH domain
MRFGTYFAKCLEKAGFTQSSFALEADYLQQNINQIIKGKRPPPLKHINAWAALLGKHVDKDVFLDLAHLENSSEQIQKLVLKLWAETKRVPR